MNIKNLLELKSCTGDVGVEIEMEGPRGFPIGVGDFWRAESDHSLRGHSIEYVMNKPVKVGEVGKHLEELKMYIRDYGSSIRYTERAGVHVHVNVQQLTFQQLINMAVVYYCLEDTLTDFCGPDRVGNHFCLRLCDAEAPIFALEEAAVDGHLYHLEGDWRYSSMNYLSLFKYGSLEFRAMETREDLGKIEDWCHILVAIRDYAKKITLTDIPDFISGNGPDAWAREVLGEKLFNVIKSDKMDNQILNGVRRTQNVIYGV